jgi:hypothetical protein
VLEETDIDIVRELLFLDPRSGELDFEPSVYCASDDDIASVATQCHAEHSASFREKPPSNNEATANLAGLGIGVMMEPSASLFAFTRENHGNCLVETEADLLRLADGFVRERAARGVKVRWKAVIAYATSLVDRGDPEWVQFLAQPGREPWQLAIDKVRRSASS